MRVPRFILALVMVLIGLVWIGQGLGFIGGSMMTGSPFWAVAGAVLLVVAALIVVLERMRAARG